MVVLQVLEVAAKERWLNVKIELKGVLQYACNSPSRRNTVYRFHKKGGQYECFTTLFTIDKKHFLPTS